MSAEMLSSLIDADPFSGAWLSDDGVYRYALWRVWDKSLPRLVTCMLNPSTADARKDDPTIRRLVSFAKRDGYGGLIVVNLYAYRATDPNTVFAIDNMSQRVGPMGERALQAAISLAFHQRSPFLCAWGAMANGFFVVGKAKAEGVQTVCLGKTKDGHPRHPLYVKGDQPMVEFTP